MTDFVHLYSFIRLVEDPDGRLTSRAAIGNGQPPGACRLFRRARRRWLPCLSTTVSTWMCRDTPVTWQAVGTVRSRHARRQRAEEAEEGLRVLEV